jgi:hypothetical protein
MQVELTSMVASVSAANESLLQLEADSELASRSQNHAVRDKVREFRDALVAGITRLRDQNEACLTEVRSQVVGIEEQVRKGGGCQSCAKRG